MNQTGKRKFYLMLPLLALPFMTLAFWALGGGKGSDDEAKTATGLNLQLPDAKLKDDKNADKLAFYKQADKDSLKRIESLKNDPGYKSEADSGSILQLIPKSSNALIQSPFSGGLDANENKIYTKINELKKQISTPAETKPIPNSLIEQGSSDQSVEKLQGMLQMISQKKQTDPEMNQLGGMLDKILDIQHPDRINELKEKSKINKQQVFSVQPTAKSDNISIMQSGRTDTIKKRSGHNSFYDLSNTLTELAADNAIEAVVHGSQTVVSGSTVKLRLTGDVYINGILVPKGNFIYGTASLENERLSININVIRYQSNLLSVALQVYDMDGLVGIHIPGSLQGDDAKETARQSLQNIELNSLDPSFTMQAANTGIQAVKNLLNKKMKPLKVMLKAGYRVLLKDNNKNNN